MEASRGDIDINDLKMIMNRLDRILSSKWQRIANVKSVQIGLLNIRDKLEDFELECLLKKISMLRSIVILRLEIYDNYIALVKPLLYYNKENIEEHSVTIEFNRYISRADDKNEEGKNKLNLTQLKPLKLINARNILITSMYYFIMWSHRCQILRLHLENIDENWIKYVIDNCDCSGVETLKMRNISLNNRLLNPQIKSTQLLMDKFVQKFKNLQRLKIEIRHKTGDEENMGLILLLKCLTPILKNNNTLVA